MNNLISFYRHHRLLLIGGALLLLLGGGYRFYPELEQLFSQSGNVDVGLKRLSKYYAKVQMRENLQARAIELTRQLEQAEQALLKADTPALAAVEIQNIINEITYANKMDVASIRVLKATDGPVEGCLTVPVQMTLRLTVRQMLDLLHRIESSKPLLAISSISVRRQLPDAPEMLNATFTVEGYMKKTAS